MIKENQDSTANIRSFIKSKIEEDRKSFFSSRSPASILDPYKELSEDILESEVKVSSIEDLLTVDSNQVFLEYCYEIILGRKIDFTGLRSFMKQLLEGHMSRKDIILSLHESDEGQQNKNLPAHIISEIETIKTQKVASGLLEERQRKNIFRKIYKKIQKKISAKLLSFIQKEMNKKLSPLIQNEMERIIFPKLYTAEYRLKNAEGRILDMVDFVSSIKYKLPHPNISIDINTDIDIKAPSSDPQLTAFLDKFYLDLLNKLRGTEEDILDRNRVYADVFLKLVGSKKDAPILDIACGRGEMLKIIKHLNLEGIGVDTNQTLIDYCKDQSLHVIKNDALSYLKSLKNNTLGAISVMHLVEHLEFEYLAKFLLESFRTLQPGGGIIIETPNPLNLVVSAVQFYMDPSHRNPIPVNLMQIILENVGFQVSHIDLGFRQAHDTPERIDNPKLEYMLNNPQDYALLGVKPV
jgi:2-polyprenyl-3-methyl-5-hydroxy-6-metoxy-1,4-benzoquinol methylase